MDRIIPKKKTLDKWKNQWEWLKIENGKLVLAATNAFMNGSDSYRTTALKDHSISKIHVQACVENEIHKGKERGEKYAPKLVKLPYPNLLLSCKVSIE